MLGVNFLMPEVGFGQLWTLPTPAFFGQGSISAVLASCPPIGRDFCHPWTEVVPSLANVTQKREATGRIIAGHLLLSATFITPSVFGHRCRQTSPSNWCWQITRSRRWLYGAKHTAGLSSVSARCRGWW